jgi:hypothetical protein
MRRLVLSSERTVEWRGVVENFCKTGILLLLNGKEVIRVVTEGITWLLKNHVVHGGTLGDFWNRRG